MKMDYEPMLRELLDQLPEGLEQLKADLMICWEVALQNRMAKLGMVPRDEFIAMQRILEQAAAKLVRLEKRLLQLEGDEEG